MRGAAPTCTLYLYLCACTGLSDRQESCVCSGCGGRLRVSRAALALLAARWGRALLLHSANAFSGQRASQCHMLIRRCLRGWFSGPKCIDSEHAAVLQPHGRYGCVGSILCMCCVERWAGIAADVVMVDTP